MMKTKKIVAVLVLVIVGLSTMNAQEMVHSKMKKDSTKMVDHSKMEMNAIYTCPMHADVKSDKPGECPKCGMELKKMEMKPMYTCSMHPEVVSDKKGECPKCGMELKKMEMKPMYTCSMHPEVVSDKKGECPKCGMDLTEKKMKIKMDNKHQTHKHK